MKATPSLRTDLAGLLQVSLRRDDDPALSLDRFHEEAHGVLGHRLPKASASP
jgi:hypothetical protein